MYSQSCATMVFSDWLLSLSIMFLCMCQCKFDFEHVDFKVPSGHPREGVWEAAENLGLRREVRAEDITRGDG